MSPAPNSALRFAAVAAAACCSLVAQPAAAQTQDRWSVALTPYVWVAGISGDVTTPRGRGPSDVNADFGDIFNNLSGFAFMGAAEVRYGRFGILGDVQTLTIESDVETPRGRLYSGGTGRISATTGSMLGLFRVWEDERNAFDIGFGGRFWQMNTKLSLDPGLLDARTVKANTNWADPVIALRYGHQFNPRWGVSVYGDIGGFGAGSDLTWQVLTTVNYRISEGVDLRAGYRHLALERDAGRAQLDFSLSGPIVGATFRF